MGILQDHTFMKSKIKMSNFCTPLPPFSVCANGSELGETSPHPWMLKLRLPTTPTPIPFRILAKNVNAKKNPKRCLQPSFLQNQTPIGLEHLYQNQTPVYNTYSRARHQSGTLIAEPDTCLDCNNTYTNFSSGHPISADPLPLHSPTRL